ncbi:PAS domain S-box protein [Mucilaginibacter segetis]|uniref:histidine kinase n=1 Tax=Mucilaginibacter segetis TaxID=2793071 RepID=A0A934PRC0_9SPHI|nr:PAS domain S-box protein [Mucilaginibacter segetis]MBK0379353.1 PAS domain S-box protein [Mucilaginibacter segetis]
MLSVYAQQTMVDTLPIGACVFMGPDHVVSAANGQMLSLWHKTEVIIGKALREAVPEILRGNFLELLQGVYERGETCREPDSEVKVVIGGERRRIYFDFSFKPLRDKDGHIYGIVHTAVETTDRVLALQELSALNEEMEASSEEVRATNEELLETQEHLERALAETAEAEERFRLATEAADVGTYDINLQTQAVVTSEQLANIFGLSGLVPSEMYVKAFHPDDLEKRQLAHQQALVTGRLFYEARIFRTDGALRWIRASGKVRYDAAGRPLRLLGTLMDITEQVSAKETERKLKTLADNSADLMSILDLNGVNSYINEAGKQLLGFESDEAVRTTPIADLHTPEDFEQVRREVLPGVMTTGKWVGIMNVRHLNTGEVFPVLNYTIRIDDPVSGQPLAVGAIMRDLRPELAAKKALADSEQLLRSVTSAAPTALWRTDAEGKLTYVNETWLSWTGRPLEAHLGRGWLQAVHPEDRQQVEDAFFSALPARSAFEVEFRMPPVSGEIRWYLNSGQPQLDSEGHFTGYVGACIDITAQKNLQQHKDDFISIASHELKTPVTSLKAALQLIDRLKDKPDPAMLSKLIIQSRKSAERVSSLIDDLLHVGRLQQKQMALNLSGFVLSQLLSNAAQPIGLSTGKHIRVQGALDLEIRADEQRIDQVITNFLTNAAKYAPNADRIDVTVTHDEQYARVSVTDYGPGIPADQLARLFERYYRVQEHTKTISGLGLGLYICKEIIERHGGQVGAESELGKGSSFWFTLPLRPVVI